MKKIFQATTCLSQEEMIQYANGEIAAERRYKIENHLLDCPLCKDALEGFTSISKTESDLSDLYDRIDSKSPLTAKSPVKRMIPWNRIAAGILFLLTIGAAFWQ